MSECLNRRIEECLNGMSSHGIHLVQSRAVGGHFGNLRKNAGKVETFLDGVPKRGIADERVANADNPLHAPQIESRDQVIDNLADAGVGTAFEGTVHTAPSPHRHSAGRRAR